MLEFILGPSGSGKSQEILKRAAKCAENGRVILIVPEQFSFETEQALYDMMKKAGNGNTENAEVLSFTRLCNRIFRRYGGLAGDYIDDSARIILMDTALNELSDMLDFYSDSAKSTSFVSSALSFVNELKNAGTTPEELSKLAGTVSDESLKIKLKELSLIAATYTALVERSYIDSRDDIMRACSLLYSASDDSFFAGAHIFIDGFKGFTAAELKMIEIMLADADTVTAALCCDESQHDDGISVFTPAVRTKKRLSVLAERNDVEISDDVNLTRSVRYNSKSLAHIEKTFLQKKSGFDGDDGGVMMFEAANIYDEVQTVAAKIMHLVKDGARFKDFVMIARNVPDYEQAVESVFSMYSIPVFFDRRSEVMTRPLITVILNALSAVKPQTGFDTASILNMMKTGLLGFTDDETALLENYCYIWDIRLSKWETPFLDNPSGIGSMGDEDRELLEKLEALRNRIVTPLLKLRQSLLDCDGQGFARAIYGFLTDMSVNGNMQAHAERLEKLGETVYSAEEATLWESVITLLEQFSVSLEGIHLSKRRFTELFELVVSKLEIGKIPQTADHVLFGQADRIRPNNPKYVFVLGANEGIFPKKCENTSLLTDSERKELTQAGLMLSGDLEESAVEERFFAYTAVSAPTDKLFVSYVKSSLSGAGMNESIIVRQITEALPKVKVIKTSSILPDFYVCGKKSGFDVLTRNYSQKDNAYISSLNSVMRELDRYDKALERIDASISKTGHQIEDKKLARALFGENIRLSPSKLDRFYGCRFSYFCYDGLKLRTRRKASLSPVESGTLIHYVLENMVKHHGAKGLIKIDDSLLKNEVDSLLYKWIEENMGKNAAENNRIKYLLTRLSMTLVRIIKHLAEEFSQSEFEPARFEMQIDRKSEVKSIDMDLPSGGKISLEGIVDRVDVMEKNGRKYVRVVDYKSGSKTFNLSDVLYGLNMQMLVYLFSIWENGEGEFEDILPAGVLYVPAKDHIINAQRSDSNDDIELEHRRKLRMNGLLLDNLESIQGMEHDVSGAFIPAKLKKDGTVDSRSAVASLTQLGQLKKYVEDTIIKMGEMLHDGDIDDVPSGHKTELPCTYCDFKAICAHSLNNRENIIGNMSKKEIFDYIDCQIGEIE